MTSRLLFVAVTNESRATQIAHFLSVSVFFSSLILSHLFLSNTWAANVDGMIDSTVDSAIDGAVDNVSGNALLKKYCSPCHGIPSAKDYKPGDWKKVILRMQGHRLRRGYKPLSKSEIIQISQFLDQASMIEDSSFRQ